MSVEVKYAVATNSMHAKEPKQATIDSASYDVFAAESKTLLLHVVTPISLELHFEIANEYFGNIYTRFVLLAKYFASCDAGVIDSGYHCVVLVLLTNHSKEECFVKKGYRIDQLVIHKKKKTLFSKKFPRKFYNQQREEATVLVQQTLNFF